MTISRGRLLRLSAASACSALAFTGFVIAGSTGVSAFSLFGIGSPRLEAKSEKVDTSAALALINGYRQANGRGKVVISPRLNAIASTQANSMASRNDMSHDVAGSFSRRMEAGGYDAAVAAENIGAGYKTLDDAMNGWKNSAPHRANLLADVTEIGIASASAAGSKFGKYWSLELAKPR